jgi:hypothetical protein
MIPRLLLLGLLGVALVPAIGVEPAFWSLGRDEELGLSYHHVELVREDAGAPSLRWSHPDSRVDVATDSIRAIGEGDITLSVWVWLDSAEPAGGDLIHAADDRGNGLSLAIVTRGGATSSLAADRQLIASLHDDAREVFWTDRGRPGRSILVHSLAVHGGHLYAGVCQPGPSERGEVFEYHEPAGWKSIGSPDGSNDVTSLATFAGALYAGTGKYRLAGSSLAESANAERGGRVYRREADGRWQVMGELPEADAVGGMVVYRDRLLVSSLYQPARLYSLDRMGSWQPQPLPEAGRRLESMTVHAGHLYATSYDNAHVYRFDGTTWEDLGSVGDNTQTYGFASYRGRLHVSTWPSGRVFRWDNDHDWADTGRLGEELEVMGLAVHRGRLWGGTLPLADVYSFRENTPWLKSGNVDATPDVKYRRAWTMAVHAGELFVGTLPSGRVWSTSVGQSVSWDEPFPQKSWHCLVVRRQGSEWSLYVDGKRIGRAVTRPGRQVSLGQVTQFSLGQGDHYPFQGKMRDLRVIPQALDESAIAELSRPKAP